MGRDSDLRSVRVSPGLCQEEDDDDSWRGSKYIFYVVEAYVPLDINHEAILDVMLVNVISWMRFQFDYIL